jgi:hypothetical protein
VYLMVGYPGEEEGGEKVSEQAERVGTERRDRDGEKRQHDGQLSDGRLGFHLIGENKRKEESLVGINERRSSSSSQRRRYIDKGIFIQFRNYFIL